MKTEKASNLILIASLAVIASAGGKLSADDMGYVGAQACGNCHKAEFQAWTGSHHDLAMQHATTETVLGDFEDAEITIHGVTSRFFRRDGRYFVHTDGPDGAMAEFEIAYTFGVAPLQQYLVPFPDGRVQALSLAWDSRPLAEGGQRWYHLYEDQSISHDDELHWTGRQQNWNYMCADCHSTNLVKGYDIASDRFETTWSEINVACEACHGPGETHVGWAGQDEQLREEDLDKGLGILLDDRSGISWDMDPSTGIARRSRALKNSVEVGVCADCHSRRGTLIGGAQADADYLDHHMPAFLTDPLYFPDGQILDEVYVWGSFTQSRMYQAGVTCSDCHDPHSLELHADNNAVCAQCHLPERFSVTSHHGHPDSADSPACVDCHMPERTYMGVDPRSDHSMRNPYPPLSATTGIPNACNQCHAGTSVEWAVDSFKRMFPDAKPPSQDWAAAFHQARKGLPQAELSLIRVAANVQKPEIARATAVLELDDYLSPISGQMLEEALRDESALVRIASLRTLEALRPEHRFDFAKHLLHDSLLAVRSEAGRILAATTPEQMTAGEGRALRAAIDDFIATQRYNGDRPESWLNLGNLHVRMGDVGQAEKDFRHALELAPDFAAGYLNLADLYRFLGRESESAELLRQGLDKQPDDAALHHALGLSLIRSKDLEGGLVPLKRSVELAPGEKRYAYVYAVGLNSAGQVDNAIAVLEQAHKDHPNDMQILQSLALFERDRGRIDRARFWVDKMIEINPADQGIQQFRQTLGPGS